MALTAEQINQSYKKAELVKFIKQELKERSVDNSSWFGLPNCDESYKCLSNLNKTVLIKIYGCFMSLD